MPTPKKVFKSHRISVQKRNLISLPKDVREKLNIGEGDVLDVRIEGNKIVMEPYKLIPSSQAYFWTQKTQNDMVEAKRDKESGKTREFKNIDEFMEGLNND
jgi:AbrB family looped-hinge helix DNA binding protein